MAVASVQGPRVIGRYALFDEIAAGGMASVHVGRLLGPAGFARTVAIKRLHPQFARDPEFVTMFLDEARLAARIQHPNVVPTLDVVASQGELFLVMEYFLGESFARLLYAAREANEAPPLDVVSAILVAVLHGLHAAHEAKNERGEPLGIVHRDVSPQNILVGVDGIARVLDFGIAKAAGRAQITREGQVRGKMAYIAPEQLQLGAADRKADVYAAAVVLWEALTGKRLFLADSEAATVARVLSAEILPPSSVVPGLAPELDAVVLKGLKREPAERFATAREMARALEAATPLATPLRVGEWVEKMVGGALATRARAISEIEQIQDLVSVGSSSRPPRLLAGSEEPTAVELRTGPSQSDRSIEALEADSVDFNPNRRRRVAVALVALVVGFLVTTAFLVFRAAEPPSRPVSPSPVAVAPSIPVPAAAAAAAAEPSSLAPAAGTPSRSPQPDGEAEATPPSSPSSISRKPGGKTKKNCEPPYTIDEAGHRRYKMECL